MACILGHHQTHGVLRDRFPNPGHHSDRHARMPRRDIAYLVVTVHYCVEEHSPDTDCVVLIDRVLQNLGLTLAPENDNFIKNNNFWLAVLAFIIYTSAFVAESLRAGINTVPFGQAEAGRSLGLSFGQNFSAIVFPQAFRGVDCSVGQHSDCVVQEHNRRIRHRCGRGISVDEVDDREPRRPVVLGVRNFCSRLYHLDPAHGIVLRLGW